MSGSVLDRSVLGKAVRGRREYDAVDIELFIKVLLFLGPPPAYPTSNKEMQADGSRSVAFYAFVSKTSTHCQYGLGSGLWTDYKLWYHNGRPTTTR